MEENDHFFSVSKGQIKSERIYEIWTISALRVFIVHRAEILQIVRVIFWKIGDFKNTFWLNLTFNKIIKQCISMFFSTTFSLLGFLFVCLLLSFLGKTFKLRQKWIWWLELHFATLVRLAFRLGRDDDECFPKTFVQIFFPRLFFYFISIFKVQNSQKVHTTNFNS